MIFGLSALLGNDRALMAGPDHKLPACPSAPNCVSSQTPGRHFVEPFAIAGEPKAAFGKLREILARRQDTAVKSADDRLIRVEFKTRLGFVDDGLFVLDEENKRVLIRSASRLGYWDFGKNRRRLEELRQEYQNVSK